MHANSTPLTVSENGQGRYQQTIRSGRHTLIADEPVGTDGADAGPAPYDFLLAALGACTSMTLRMYAQHKGLALTHVSVALTHQKIDDEDKTRVDRIERIITLEGDLNPEQRQRLLDIANKCPMYRTLHAGIRIDSRVAE